MTFADDVAQELARAIELFPGQEETVTLGGWLSILVEEVGEVARALNEYEVGDLEDTSFESMLHMELVQVGAMAERMDLAWRAQRDEEGP